MTSVINTKPEATNPTVVTHSCQEYIFGSRRPLSLSVMSKDQLTQTLKANPQVEENPTSGGSIVLVTPAAPKKFIFDEDEDFSVISLLAEMVTSLALADSASYQVQFRQSIETSNYAARLAPIVREFVLANWDNQSKITDLEADKAKAAGIGILIAGTAAGVLGGVTYFGEVAKDAENAVAKPLAQEASAAADGAAAGGVARAAGSSAAEVEMSAIGRGISSTPSGPSSVGTSASRATDPAASSASRSASRALDPVAGATPTQTPATPAASPTKDALNKGKSAISKAAKMGQVIAKVMGGMQVGLQMADGGIKLGADMRCDYQKAGKQQLVGQADAHEKETSAYQGNATSSGQRMGEAASQSQKNHGETLAIMRQAADTISQAVCAAQRA